MDIEKMAVKILTDKNFSKLNKIIASLMCQVYMANVKRILFNKKIDLELKKDLDEARHELEKLGISFFSASNDDLYRYLWKINIKLISLSK